MNARVQPSLLLPLTAAESIAEMRRILADAEARESADRQRAALARKVALADLIEARAE